MFGQISGIRPDIWPNILHLPRCLVRNPVSGRIFGQIRHLPRHWARYPVSARIYCKIRHLPRHLARYPVFAHLFIGNVSGIFQDIRYLPRNWAFCPVSGRIFGQMLSKGSVVKFGIQILSLFKSIFLRKESFVEHPSKNESWNSASLAGHLTSPS